MEDLVEVVDLPVPVTDRRRTLLLLGEEEEGDVIEINKKNWAVSVQLREEKRWEVLASKVFDSRAKSKLL